MLQESVAQEPILQDSNAQLPIETLAKHQNALASYPFQDRCSVSFLIPACESSTFISQTLDRTHEFLTLRFGADFEIIVIVNGNNTYKTIQSILEFKNNSIHYSNIHIVECFGKKGKGAALKAGFQKAKGERIFFTDADLPYDLGFFDEASKKLVEGYSLVVGSRRLDQSRISVSERFGFWLKWRDFLGKCFNKVVRVLFPIQSLDTQAGIKAMTRSFADLAFSKQTCSSFYFDIELFLSAKANDLRFAEVPVHLRLRTNRSSLHIHREVFGSIFWISKLLLFYRLGHYGRDVIASRYKNVPMFTRLFIHLRLNLTPYRDIAAFIPMYGKVLDLGCGHGLFSLCLANQSSNREITGIDHDSHRILIAKKAAFGLKNVHFYTGKIQSFLTDHFDSIALLDAIHYLSAEEQYSLLVGCYETLTENGVLVLRDIEPVRGLRSKLNRVYEYLAKYFGLTKSDSHAFHFRASADWVTILEKIGFKVSPSKCSHFLFSDVLFVCVKN